ncbi:MAG: ATP-binding protein [Myxococcota bacterium]|nr:ATP-binding protein [Myxococcota bacterium]
MRESPADPGARALREAVVASIIPTAWVVAALYGLLVIIHPFALPGEHRWTMSIIAVCSAALSAVTALWWKRQKRPAWAHLVNAWLASIVLINTVLHFILFPQAGNTTNFIILILGAGLVLLSRISFYIVVFLALGSWVGIVGVLKVPDPNEWGWFLFFAVFVGIILEEQRIHATRASGGREQLLIDRSTALQKLVQTQALTDSDILQLIGESACSNLSASSVDIWLSETQSEQLQHVVAQEVPHPPDQNESPPTGLELSPELRTLLLENRTVANREPNSLLENEHRPNQPTLHVGIISARHISGVIRIKREVDGSLFTLEDQMFAASIADLANLALQTRQRFVLERRAREAEHLESLGVLAGGVAHDFNNLLTVILGNIELMMESPDISEDSASSLQSMMDAGSRARDLAQQMLAYAGRAHRETRTLDLADFALEIDRGWAHDLLDRIEVEFHIEPSQIFPVDVDPTQIQQVILNLLTNARDAGATQIRISVGRTTSSQESDPTPRIGAPNRCWLEVVDNGCGMGPYEIDRIFEPFYTTREMGTGLGLAASLGIMRAHRGTLEVESTPGEGSCFRIQLPRSDRPIEPLATEGPGELTPVDSQQDVLVVEDETLVADLVREILEQSGRRVTLLNSLSAAKSQLGIMDLDTFEFALIDVTLSDGSGLDVATAARERCQTLPVILMSGYDARNALSNRSLGNTVEFLSKPFSRGSLQTSIDKAIASAPRG